MQDSTMPSCHLFLILARRAPRAVIFRRGPSEWTELILWCTDTNELAYGQWFKGRIYERRSDLSPDGTKLIYFASKFSRRTLVDREYTHAWTAISKPPYLTALALWPKGDCWHGGGLFENENAVFLNHKPDVASPHPKHIPQGLSVRPNPDAHGEDEPLHGMRLRRDGWKMEQEWQGEYKGRDGGYVTEQPEIWARPHPWRKHRILMARRVRGETYRETFSVVGRDGCPLADTAGVSWADWEQHGKLVLLKEGKLLIATQTAGEQVYRVRELADFSTRTPEPIVPPAWATQW